MTWMTPFEARTSARRDARAADEHLARRGRGRGTRWPLSVLIELPLDDLRRGQLALGDVVEQHRAQLGLVLRERVERRLRHLGERRVGRREDGVRALALQRPGEAGLLQQRGERLELRRPRRRSRRCSSRAAERRLAGASVGRGRAGGGERGERRRRTTTRMLRMRSSCGDSCRSGAWSVRRSASYSWTAVAAATATLSTSVRGFVDG